MTYSFGLYDPKVKWFVERVRAARRFATSSKSDWGPAELPAGRNGWYRMIVDPNTGRVTDVEVVETSSSASIDQTAMKAFRQWRFRPHTVTTVTVPAQL